MNHLFDEAIIVRQPVDLEKKQMRGDRSKRGGLRCSWEVCTMKLSLENTSSKMIKRYLSIGCRREALLICPSRCTNIKMKTESCIPARKSGTVCPEHMLE